MPAALQPAEAPKACTAESTPTTAVSCPEIAVTIDIGLLHVQICVCEIEIARVSCVDRRPNETIVGVENSKGIHEESKIPAQKRD